MDDATGTGRSTPPEGEEVERLRARMREDERLLRKSEQALAEIKIAQGLSERHASVLAALRIRLKGDPGKSLEDLLTAAGDLGSGRKLDALLDDQGSKKRSLDDVLAAPKKPKPTWPG
ncbi:MAG TPA: hypothetical protein DIT48_05325 [Actinobacteria bacterium]|nr:hypothetical protein [Actinomycetota bacterium]